MELYTDGAVSKNGYNGAYGAYAWALIKDDTCIDYASWSIEPATNNVCEMMAIITACEEYEAHYNEPVTVYSDSAYCINCLKQKWYLNWQKNGWVNAKKQPVANRTLWEKLIPFFENPLFTFEKTKGHAGNKDRHSYWNDFVDKLAVAAKQEKKGAIE